MLPKCSKSFLRHVLALALALAQTGCTSAERGSQIAGVTHSSRLAEVVIRDYAVARAVATPGGNLIILGYKKDELATETVLASWRDGAWRELDGYDVRAFAVTRDQSSESLVALATQRGAQATEELLQISIPDLEVRDRRNVRDPISRLGSSTRDDSLDVLDDGSAIVAIREIPKGLLVDRKLMIRVETIRIADGVIVRSVPFDGDLVNSAVALPDGRSVITTMDDVLAFYRKVALIDRDGRVTIIDERADQSLKIVGVLDGEHVVTEERSTQGTLDQSDICLVNIDDSNRWLKQECFGIDGVNASLFGGQITAVTASLTGESAARVYDLPATWS
jgi:hypothetical protein